MPDHETGMAAGASPLLFVSYTPKDEDWASWIAWELEGAGYRVVLQAWDFVPGTNFVDFMDRGVAGAAAVIAVLSRSYLSSRFGRWEWQTAILAEPDNPEAKLITVRVEECPLEGLLSTITYVDLVGVQDQHEAMERLLTRVGQTLAGRAKPGTAPAFPPAALAAHTAAVPVEIVPVEIVPAAIASAAIAPAEIARPGRQQREHPRRRPATRPAYPPAHHESAPPRDGVAILHVPGPRFGRGLPAEGVPATATELQARIWADVNRMADAGAPRPDLLVVSGDLTESGSLREFDEAITFLTGLRALLGLEADRCVIVPGSHDITRRACEAYFADCEADDIEPRPPYWPKWRHFSRVFDELYRDIEGLIFDRSQPWTFFTVPDLRIVVAGLNSTMAESHRPEDRYGSVGEAQAAWFAERLRPYADDGWLRLAAVAHDPAVMRDADATGQLLGTRINVLLHGASGNDPNLFSRMSLAPSPWFRSSSAVGDGTAGSVLLAPAGTAGQHEILHLTADGMTRWRPADKSPRRSAHHWRSASATFPPPPEPEGQALPPEAETAGNPGDDLAALAAARDDPDEVSGRVASPALRLLDQVAEVVEAGHPGAKLRRVTADGPPHLLVTHAEDGFVRQWRVAAHAGKATREVVDEFAVVIHSGEQESGAELVYSGPRAPQVLRAEALRRGIRVRSFTEFQGLLDLRDYVAGQAARLQADQRYPHPLYVPQRFRDLESASGSIADDLVAELLRELAADTGRFILLLADFGRGKTFALRELARHIPTRLPHLIPIYVELRDLDKAHSVDGLVAAHLANHGEDVIDLKAFRYMLAQGRIVLLFDGFDELATRVTFDRAADHLQTLLAAAEGRAKVVIASRTQHFKSDAQVFTALGERVGLLPGRRVLGIEDFGEDQILAYLRNWYGEEHKASERLRLISGIEDLLGLSSNPRMLSFIAQLDERRLRGVASAGHTLSGADLYREILDAWLTYEHDRAQDIPGAPAGLTLADLWRAVTVLAMRLNESGESLIRLDALAAEAATSLAGLASGRLTAQQSVHAIGAGSLLVRSEDGMFGFIHASVAEWLVANEIAERLGTGSSGTGSPGTGSPGTGAPEDWPAGDDGDATGVLARRVLAQLTIDFLCDLADPLALRAWMSGVLGDPRAADASRTNALRVSARLRVPAKTDLRGASLQGEDLSRRELGQVDFTGADLTGARLVGSDLSGAVLAAARLNGARLDGARLRGADLRGADLRGARLTRADLTGARLEGSQWNRAALIDVAGLPDGGSVPELRGAAIAPGLPVETEIAPADIGVPYGYHYQTARLPQPLSYSSDGSLLAVGSSDGGVTLCDTATGLPVRTLRGHGGRVYGVTYAAADHVLVTAASDATLRLWDTTTGECARVIEVPEPGAWPAEVSPDGRVMAYGSPDGIVRLLNVESGRTLAELPGHATPVYTVAFGRAASGRAEGPQAVITGDRAGAIRIWDQATGSLLAQFAAGHGTAGHGGPVYRLLAAPDGSAAYGAVTGGATMFAAGGESGTLVLLDARGLVAADLAGHTGAVYALDFSPAQPLLASGDTDGGVRLWDVDARSPRAVLSPHPGAIYGLSFSPDGSLLASASNDGLVRITSVADGRVRHELAAHRSAVWRPVFSPDGAQLATGSNDSTCRLWDTASGQSRHVLRGHGRRVTSVTFSADGAMLAAGGNDGVVRVWDPVTGQQRHALTGAADRLVSAVFGPVPELLAAASNDGGVYLWNAVTGIYEQEMNVETERVWAETFSPDGEVLATANDDDSVRLWYRSTGRNILTLTEHNGRVRSLAFSPSGDLLATGCDDRGVRVWDTATGALRAWMRGHTDRVYAVAFSPSGDLLASVGNDGIGCLWDPAAGTPVGRIEPHGGKLWTTAFSPSGDMLATAGDDGVIRLWSVPDGAALHALTGHADRVAAVAFSPSGEFLASAADDGTVRVWSLPGAAAGGGGPALRVTLLGAEDGWAAFSPDGRYKLDGTIAGQFWHVIGACRFEPGELDPYLPAVKRLPADAPF